MVPWEGLEPPRRKAQVPKTCVSTEISPPGLCYGGSDGARTRDLWRDRPAL